MSRPGMMAAPHMWVGEFTKSDGTKLYSNTSDWVFKVGSGANPGIYGDLDYNTVKQDIAAGVWAQPPGTRKLSGRDLERRYRYL